jgi:hypothetical protein
MKKITRLILVLVAIGAVINTPLSIADDNMSLQDFDRNACYSTCGCDARGMEAACFSCRQECDRKFWADFDRENTEEKVGSMDDDNN